MTFIRWFELEFFEITNLVTIFRTILMCYLHNFLIIFYHNMPLLFAKIIYFLYMQKTIKLKFLFILYTHILILFNFFGVYICVCVFLGFDKNMGSSMWFGWGSKGFDPSREFRGFGGCVCRAMQCYQIHHTRNSRQPFSIQ